MNKLMTYIPPYARETATNAFLFKGVGDSFFDNIRGIGYIKKKLRKLNFTASLYYRLFTVFT